MTDPTAVAALLWNMISAFAKGYGGQRRSFFEDHIEPLNSRLVEIHHDYVEGFEAADTMLKEASPTQALIDFLEGRRRDLAIERQMSRDLATELAKVDKVAIRGEASDAVRAYSESIVSYFHSALGSTRMSWYSDYIHYLQSQVRLASNQGWGSGGAFSNDCRRDLQEQLEFVLDS